MPMSASLREIVSEDQKDMGCMTGILQIFDRRPSFSGRHCGCRWNATRNGKIVTTASGRVYHELRCNPAYDMSVDSQPRASSMDHLDQLKTAMDNARLHSWESGNSGPSIEKSKTKNGDSNCFRNQELVEPVQTTKPHLSFYIQDSLPFPSSENKAPWKEAPSLSFRSQSQHPNVSGPRLRAPVDGMLAEKTQPLKLEAPDIKDVVCESFHSQWQRVPCLEDATPDCDTWAPLLLKQVSSGLGSGRDKKSEVPCKGGRVEQLIAHSDLPCSCSVNTRTDQHMHHLDGCQMRFLLDSTEKDALLPNEKKLSTLRRCLEGDEISRLSVELGDGPLISASSSRRNSTIVPQDSYKPLNNSYYVKEVRDPCPTGVDFKDAHQASQQCRDGDWFHFDRRNDLPSAASYPRLSIDDGTDVSSKNSFSGPRGDHQKSHRCLETNVVARLMGLEKFPSSEIWKTPPQKPLFSRSPLTEAKLVQGLVHYNLSDLSDLPQARLSDKFSQMSDRGGLGSCQKQDQWDSNSSEAHELRSRSPSLSPKFMEGMPLVFKKPHASNALKSRVSQICKQFSKGNTTVVQKSDCLATQEALYGDMAQHTCQPRLRNSLQECKTLKQIQEDMQLKGLLDPSNDKQVQGPSSKLEGIIPIKHLQPQWAELIQQPLISSKCTITIFNEDQVNLKHQETPALESDGLSMSFNTRTHEQIVEGPKKNKPVSLETYSQTMKSDLSIVVMKPIKTKIASKLQAPKSTPPKSTTRAGSKKGVTMKTAQRKPHRAQARSSNKDLKDGQDLSQQPLQLVPYSTTPTIKSQIPPQREPNFLKPRPQCRCGFGSGRTGEKRNLKWKNSPLSDHQEHKVANLATLDRQKVKAPFKGKAKTNSDTLRSWKTALSDTKFKPRLPDPSRKSQRSMGTFVKLPTHKSKLSNRPSNMPQFSIEKETLHSADTVMVEDETGKASTFQPWIDESEIGEVHVHMRAMESEALDQSGDICAPTSDILKLPANMELSDIPGEYEVLTAEVIKANRGPGGEEEEVSPGLQILPHFLVDKFELNQRLPTVDGMEQHSPVSVHNNTAFADEESTPTLQSCTSASSFQVVVDALEANNNCGSLFEDVDTEEDSLTVRRKLCFEIDPKPQQQQQLCRSVTTSRLEIELPFDSDNRTAGNSGKTSTTGTSFENKEEGRQFVRDLLVVSELTKEVHSRQISKHHQPGAIAHTSSIDPFYSGQRQTIMEDNQNLTENYDVPRQECLQSKERSTTKENKNKNKKKQKQKELLDRRLVFDAVNEIASRKLPLHSNRDLVVPNTPSFFIHYPHHRHYHHLLLHHHLLVSVQEKKDTAQSFAQQVWDELQQLPGENFHNVFDTVHGILDKETKAKLQQSWAEIRDEMREVVLEVEHRIFRELVSGVITEFLRKREAHNQKQQQQQQQQQLRSKGTHEFSIRV